MHIRKYQASDCKAVLSLFYDCVHTVNAKDYTKLQLHVWASGKEDEEVWNQSLLKHDSKVMVEKDKIVGFGDMDEFGYLDRLYVHKDFQHLGIATKICNALENGSNASTFTTYASITAKAFFEQRGYHVVASHTVVRQGVSISNNKMIKIKK